MNDCKSRFVELLLVFLIIFFSALAVSSLCAGKVDLGTAMLDNIKLVLGALLGLITGVRMSQRNSDGNPPGK